MKTLILQKPAEVIDRLAELGVSYEILSSAIIAGEIARDGCTANDPVNTRGFVAWSRTVRILRELLIPKGWTRRDERGLPLVVSPDGKIAIVVGLGDEMTSRPDCTPKTKYAKGPATVAVINRNVQLRLFGEVEIEDANDVVVDPNIETYVLLRHRTADVAKAELSVPASSDDDGRISSWSKRIILPDISLAPNTGGDNPRDSGEKIEVSVVRR